MPPLPEGKRRKAMRFLSSQNLTEPSENKFMFAKRIENIAPASMMPRLFEIYKKKDLSLFGGRQIIESRFRSAACG